MNKCYICNEERDGQFEAHIKEHNGNHFGVNLCGACALMVKDFIYMQHGYHERKRQEREEQEKVEA